MGEIRVVTSSGALVGTTVDIDETPVAYFGGVSYAAPPVGDLRFAAPQPPNVWDGERLANTAGPAAPQPLSDDELVPDMAPATTSEACLNAEIWSADLDGEAPVLVWIPGGRFQIGAAGLATYSGARLAAEQNLVVVGLNYRLGALGFMNGPGIATNLGLRDLLAGLAWIHEQIANFGGDPRRDGVFAETAGAGAIAHLLASPAADGLLHGAVLASGAPGSTLDAAQADLVTTTFLDALGVETLDELRAAAVDDILAAQTNAADELLLSVGMMPFHPVVDGDIVPIPPMQAAREGSLLNVAMLVGSTQHEMELFRDAVPELPPEFAHPMIEAKLAALGYGDDADVEAGFAAVGHDLVEAIAYSDIHLPAFELVACQTRRGVDAWRYRFDWSGGASHAYDLPFWFGTLDVANWRDVVGAGEGRASEADRLGRRMRDTLGSFVRDLVPSCDPIGSWPCYTDERRTATVLADDVSIDSDHDGQRIRSWRSDK